MSENKINDGVAVVYASNGQAILCSPEDHQSLSLKKWRVGANGYAYQAGGNTKGRQCLMHRIILNAGAGQEVHHQNGNKLDNRHENLELTTASEHQRHHVQSLIERNKEKRIYPEFSVCPTCGKEYRADPNHRGRQVACSKSCGTIFGKRRKREQENIREQA